MKAIIREIQYKMKNVQSYEEYCDLRKELRCCKLQMIPFVNEKNVMSLYDFLYGKRKKENKDSISRLLLPSAVGIFVCAICMCGMTWAWYTASVTNTQKVTTAYYAVDVTSISENGTELVESNGGYVLNAGSTYSISLKASGTVKACGGYCLIENEDGTVKEYTQVFNPEETISFEYSPSKDGTYTFTGMWGSQPSTVAASDLIKNGATVTRQAETETPTLASSEIDQQPVTVTTTTKPTTNDEKEETINEPVESVETPEASKPKKEEASSPKKEKVEEKPIETKKDEKEEEEAKQSSNTEKTEEVVKPEEEQPQEVESENDTDSNVEENVEEVVEPSVEDEIEGATEETVVE